MIACLLLDDDERAHGHRTSFIYIKRPLNIDGTHLVRLISA